MGHFGAAFGRPFDQPLPWMDDDAEPNADMWATADESWEQIVGLYHVPWWPRSTVRSRCTASLVHTIAEAHRHTGHPDIVRELIDGSVGLLNGNDNMPPGDGTWWEGYRRRLEQVARDASSA